MELQGMQAWQCVELTDAHDTIVEQRGTLSDGARAITFSLSQPTPSHWVAVASYPRPRQDTGQVTRHRLFVGCGRSADAAIDDLTERVATVFDMR
jgi:hypothetical protein